MNEMIMRVARAIAPDAFFAVPITGEHRRQQEQARRDAVAAIVAMREPTEAMRINNQLGFPSGGQAPVKAQGAVLWIDPDDIWRAMIDAALKDA